MPEQGRAALAQFVAELQRLRQLAGSPSLNALVALTADLERPLPRSTISDKLNAKSLPDWNFVVSFTTACKVYAERTGQPLPAKIVDITYWDSVHWRMLQAVDRAHADERLMAAAKAEISRRTSETAAGRTPPARVPEARTTRVVPRQLPAAVRHFAGRATELAALAELVQETTHATGQVVVLAIEGTAGIGKTTLAVHWAHQVADRFPDGQLYVNLRGFDPTGQTMPANEAILRFLEAFAVPTDQIPTTLEARAALYRSVLAGKRVLVLLDNAREAEQIRPLLPGTPGCLVVVTSRAQLTSLVASEAAHWLTLDVLTPAEGRQLLEDRLGRQRLAAEPRAVDDIIARCARLPLALSIVAARAATRPTHPLARLAAELGQVRGCLDAYNGGDPTTDVRSVFSWSYQRLSPEAAGLFRFLGLHPGPDIGTLAAVTLAAKPPERVHRLLTELTRTNLITEHQPDRYTFHDLLRAYATELANTNDSEELRHAATRRLLDHYLYTAHAASRQLDPHRSDPITPTPPGPGVVTADVSDHERALAWFAVEQPVLLAVVEAAAATGLDTYAYQLVRNLAIFLTRQGRWPELIAAQRTALAAAERLGDPAAQAYAHRSLGIMAVELSEHEEAERHLRAALDLFGAAGDRTNEAQTHIGFSRELERRGRYREALKHAMQAHDLYQAADHLTGQANALNSIGWCHALLGEYHQALVMCGQAIALVRKTGDRWVEAAVWDSTGYAHHHLGDHQRAAACYQRALDMCRELGARHNETDILIHLGETQRAAGDRAAARAAWQEALSIGTELNHPDTAEIITRLRRLDDEVADTTPRVNGSHRGNRDFPVPSAAPYR
jgi:tetratricopeptide (TPR) repeat protein